METSTSRSRGQARARSTFARAENRASTGLAIAGSSVVFVEDTLLKQLAVDGGDLLRQLP